jgi:hypothetical protein
MQKEKSRKFCIYTVKMAAKSSLVTLFALVIHTAPTVPILTFRQLVCCGFFIYLFIPQLRFKYKKTKSMLIFFTFRKRDNVTITVSEEDRRVRGQGEARLTVN